MTSQLSLEKIKTSSFVAACRAAVLRGLSKPFRPFGLLSEAKSANGARCKSLGQRPLGGLPRRSEVRLASLAQENGSWRLAAPQCGEACLTGQTI